MGTLVLAISANYPTPVYVNGYACNNCAQVAEAKQDINPADPKAGPWGVDAKPEQATNAGAAFILGGSLASAATNGATSTASAPGGSTQAQTPTPSATGNFLDVSA
jgi:hypothetical protein